MRPNAVPRVALALCLLAILTNCGDRAALVQAGSAIGTTAAGVTLPAWPDDCRKHVQTTGEVARVGDDAFTLLRRADRRIEEGNGRVDRCADFYDSVSTNLGRRPGDPVSFVPPSERP